MYYVLAPTHRAFKYWCDIVRHEHEEEGKRFKAVYVVGYKDLAGLDRDTATFVWVDGWEMIPDKELVGKFNYIAKECQYARRRKHDQNS